MTGRFLFIAAMEAIFSSLTSGAKFNKKRNAASLELFSRAVGIVTNFLCCYHLFTYLHCQLSVGTIVNAAIYRYVSFLLFLLVKAITSVHK